MEFNDWYINFLKEDKTNLSDREMLFMAFTAGQNSLPVEAQVKHANGGHIGECRMCFEREKELHYFDLYVTGSEGIWICEDCRTLITENIRIIKADNLHKKLQKEKASRLSV